MSSTLFFKELALRNFLSFGQNETIIDLSEPGTVSIEGLNLDQGGSNGSGKTTLINALCYALYNKPFDNISLQRLINSTNASKNTLMEVRLAFERAGDEYEILRTRGEQFTISITKNGDDITPGKGVTECDALIEDIIGVSYELFTKTIIFSGNATAFLQLPIAQQRAQIEELFNITLLSEKAAKLRELIKQTEGDLKVQEAVVKQQEVALELHQKQVQTAETRVERWDQSRRAEIADIERTLAVVGAVDFELEQLLHAEKAELSQEGAYLAAKLAPLRKDQQQLSKNVKDLMAEHAHLKDAKCPYCAQSFTDAPAKLKTVLDDIDTQSTKLVMVEQQVTEYNEAIKTQSTRLKEVVGSIQHTNLSELLAARENASVMRLKLNDLQTATNPHTDALEQLYVGDAPAVETDKVDALRKRLEHQAFLLKLLVNKDSFLRRRIINKTIPFLNERINTYTRQLGLSHIVRFDADMSCAVAEFGRELDFGNLSAGEKKRVNTALALAFRDVLHHLHAKSNLLLIDELDGQLDGAGIDAIIHLLKQKARDEDLGIYVISHHPAVAGRLDRTMIISKQHGFSTISDVILG
jgi:DNA repair exonuclease SbcCD ATPase subunit